MHTPWGESDHVELKAPGIVFYSTPSHGGFKVNEPLLSMIPQAWRSASFNKQGAAGWFEEDCDWCMVALTFPQHFPNVQKEAQATFNHYIAKKIAA